MLKKNKSFLQTLLYSKNFQSILEGYLAEGTDEMRHQIEYLIKQINNNNTNEDAESDTEDGDEDEEEDPIIMEANLDRNEIFIKQSAEELIGESLLTAEYSLNNNETKSKSRRGIENLNESTVLNRPITPLNLRQSVLLQTKPFNTNEIFNDNKTNILTIESNDLSVDDNYLKIINDTKNKYQTTVTESTDIGFAARPRIQRTPDTSNTNQKRAIINTSIQSSSSITPKYSITEPRPSSANSTKSKSTSSSGTIVPESSINSNSSQIKRK